ncbi:type II toxin-antitoxin system RelE/ParE family toxin [Scandinavium sp.]|uniref:type II toxin-antitoxin system RelE/ParE family toxin n=1 Tax=Scandinavium sp. TaxID=2830653 RepID=UPI00289E1E7B|nr:type II toxin-antitoxin system RelE/ParE family toxin [Scandinavium sp.]
MWVIKTTDTFDGWFLKLQQKEKACVTASMIVLATRGPNLARPHADTVKASRFSNMKELRVQCRGDPLRAFYAFIPDRSGVMLCGGKKSGNERQFYRAMIRTADNELAGYLKKHFYIETR